MRYRFLDNDAERAFYRLDLLWPLRLTSTRDLETITGPANLKQAIGGRAATSKGEIEHRPGYGMELEEHVGAPNCEEEHAIVQAQLLEQLRREPRIQEAEVFIRDEDEDVFAQVSATSRVGGLVNVDLPLVQS